MIDNLSTSDEEKLKLKNELLQIENAAKLNALEYEKTVVDAKAKVMVAELEQKDNYVKRARPTILYGGLFALFTNYIILPWIAHFTGGSLPSIDLPSEFWYAWGGVASVYSFRRTDEKIKGVQS
ncbi:MAG: holin family protein [Bacteroidetes bacterium]|nr:holin family protein [Bacteroidota bacterium]